LKSYIILGIYGIMAAIYYNGESSLFVLMASIFMELILLFLGALILKSKIPANESDLGLSGAFYALLACVFFIYPMVYMVGVSYNEFTTPANYSYMQPIVDYKWQLLLMAITLGVGYLVDFKTLNNNSIGPFISSEVIRISFLLFAVGLLGMMWLEWVEDWADFTKYNKSHIKDITSFTKDSKITLILIIISARMLIEIWYMKRVKIYIKH